jgi:hypothetical protein
LATSATTIVPTTEQAEDQERARAEFGDRGGQRVHPAGPDADGLEPPRRPGQLAAAEGVVPAVRDHGAADHQAEHERRDIHTVHSTCLRVAAGRECGRLRRVVD